MPRVVTSKPIMVTPTEHLRSSELILLNLLIILNVMFQLFVRIVQVCLKKEAVYRGVLENLASLLTPVKKVVGKN